MSRVHRRGVIAGPKGGGTTKTYAEFQAYIATQATDGDRSWLGASLAPGNWRWTAASPAGGSLVGSSWGPSSTDGFGTGISGSIARVVQHGLPSEAAFNAQVSGGLQGFVRIVGQPFFPLSLPAVNRNGFLSASASEPGGLSAQIVTRLDYFDPVLGPMTMNPSTGTGPTPFTW